MCLPGVQQLLHSGRHILFFMILDYGKAIDCVPEHTNQSWCPSCRVDAFPQRYCLAGRAPTWCLWEDTFFIKLNFQMQRWEGHQLWECSFPQKKYENVLSRWHHLAPSGKTHFYKIEPSWIKWRCCSKGRPWRFIESCLWVAVYIAQMWWHTNRQTYSLYAATSVQFAVLLKDNFQ